MISFKDIRFSILEINELQFNSILPQIGVLYLEIG